MIRQSSRVTWIEDFSSCNTENYKEWKLYSMISLPSSSWVTSLPYDNSKLILLGGRCEEQGIKAIRHKEQGVKGEYFLRKYSLIETDSRSKSFETKFSWETERSKGSLGKPSLHTIMEPETTKWRLSKISN